MEKLKLLISPLLSSARDLLPIVVVIAFFQIFVLQQPIPNSGNLLVGALLVVSGLALFVQGLEMGLFPIGESMAYSFARKGSLSWLLIFAFALGFGTTIAEPALIAVAAEAAEVAAAGNMIADCANAKQGYADGLRVTVALSVGFAILVGVLRIVRGWPIHYLIIAGYVGVIIMTAFAPPEIIGIAYDSGGVTTSTITVPLVTALGVPAVLTGLGMIFDDYYFFRSMFEDQGVFGRTVMFVNQASDPIVERLLAPDLALKVAERFAVEENKRVLVLENVPLLSSENYNEAKRFVTLIDALYEARVRLIATAADEPERLYIEGAGSFEFERTASRIVAKLYARTPQGGEAAEFIEVASATNVPLYLLQPQQSAYYWRSKQVRSKLEEGGAQVYLHILKDVGDGFYARPDYSQEEERATRRLPAARCRSGRGSGCRPTRPWTSRSRARRGSSPRPGRSTARLLPPEPLHLQVGDAHIQDAAAA